MPTYTYRRADGTTFEIQQRITEDPLKSCPTTGQPVTRVISGNAGLIFKGSGFYLTDYVRTGEGSKNGTKASNGTSSPESKADDKGKDTGSSSPKSSDSDT